MARKRLGEILVEAGVLDESKIQAALQYQKKMGGPLGRALIDLKAISEEMLVVALSKQLNFPTVDLDKVEVPPGVLEFVPALDAQRLGIIPLKLEGKFLDIAMTNPTDIDAIDSLRTRIKLNLRPYIAGPKAIERALLRLYKVGFDSMGTGGGNFFMPEGGRVIDPEHLRSVDIDLSDGSAEQGQTRLDEEVQKLQNRLRFLEQQLKQNENILKSVVALMVEKGLLSREEVKAKLS